jgi:nitrogen regulatory protein PII
MTDSIETVSLKLVSVIGSFHLADRIADELRKLGVKGYTRSKADGWGAHGSRRAGFLEGANIRIDTLVDAALAPRVLHAMVANFEGQVVAFAVDAEAVPVSHFGVPTPTV